MRYRGQIALEYLSIVILLLLVVGVIFGYSTVLSQASIQFEKAKNSAKSLANAANTVYGLGSGAKLVVEIDAPAGIQKQIIGKKAVGWNVSFAGSTGDVFYETDANIIGSLPTTEGKHFVTVQMEESGVVRIGTKGLDIKPELVALAVLPGSTKTADLNAVNNSGEALTSVSPAVTGNAASFITVSGLSPNISIDSNDAFQISVSVPGDNAAGFFDAKLEVTSAQNYNDISAVSIEVPHVLNDVNVLLFNDAFFAAHSSSFFPGNTVYYEIRLFDQNRQLMDVTDLNIAVKDDDSDTMQSLKNLSSSNGKYQGSYAIPCSVPSDDTGTWSVNAAANRNKKISDLNAFTLNSVQQQADFNFDWSTASFDGSRKRLENWNISNIGNCQTITITKMKVTWSNDTDNAKLKKIKLNNQDVWSGTGNSGATLNLNPNFSIAALTSYSSQNSLEFDKVVNDDGETFQIEFTFSDNSTFTTLVYQS